MEETSNRAGEMPAKLDELVAEWGEMNGEMVAPFF